MLDTQVMNENDDHCDYNQDYNEGSASYDLYDEYAVVMVVIMMIMII